MASPHQSPTTNTTNTTTTNTTSTTNTTTTNITTTNSRVATLKITERKEKSHFNSSPRPSCVQPDLQRLAEESCQTASCAPGTDYAPNEEIVLTASEVAKRMGKCTTSLNSHFDSSPNPSCLYLNTQKELNTTGTCMTTSTATEKNETWRKTLQNHSSVSPSHHGNHVQPDAHPKNLTHSRNLTQLHGDSYDVVVFSLLLSYLPSTSQRMSCCVNAHRVLRLHGLLLIVTPDSSHQNRHAALMVGWRTCIEALGFHR